ncbi:MAG TPA: type VI secretion system-associated protein TagF [Thiothrix sp.]|nr:type VI secretion system-associated protein TagF [Thiothrix sp.]
MSTETYGSSQSYSQIRMYQGYYGKVPTHGDFVSGSLPRQFIDPWDTWLQQAMATSRQQIGENWLNSYLTAPPYHYVLSPNLCGENIWLGVMIPSVDRIGRYYPLTLCRTVSPTANPLLLFQQHQQWFTDAQTLLLSCLEEAFELAEFEQKLKHLVINESNTPTVDPLQVHQEVAWRVESERQMVELCPALFSAVLDKFCMAYSIWKTEGSYHTPPSFLLAQGFPPFESVSPMLDGRWHAYGWKNRDI